MNLESTVESVWFKHALLDDASVGTCRWAASDGRSEDGVKRNRNGSLAQSSICDSVSLTKAQLLYFCLLFSSTEIDLELVLLLSLASDRLWWGVLTAFVRSPKRLLEWPLCRRGDDITLLLVPCPSGQADNHTSEKTGPFQPMISSSPLPLRPARFTLKVGGHIDLVQTKVLRAFLFYLWPFIHWWISRSLSGARHLRVPLVLSSFMQEITFTPQLYGRTWWGQRLWVHSCTGGDGETAANELFYREWDGELLELWKQVAGVGG